jgi:hypothetical protein
LRALALDTILLPRPNQHAFYLDGLLDLLVANTTTGELLSIEDTILKVRSLIKAWHQDDMASELEVHVKNMAIRLFFFFQSKKIPSDSKITSVLKTLKVKEDMKQGPIVLVSTYKSTRQLVVRLPDVDLSKEDVQLNVGHLLQFASSLLQINPSAVRIVTDSTLGRDLLIKSSQQKMLDNFIKSSQSPLGEFNGGRVNLASGVKANAVEMLAIMHLLHRKVSYVRRRSPRTKDEKVAVENSHAVQQVFNSHMGMSSMENTFMIVFMKAVFSTLVKASNENFPGGWIASMRRENKVSTDIGMLFKLGYTEKIPQAHKISEVLFNEVLLDKQKKVDFLSNVTSSKDKRNLSFIEYRTAVALSLPLVDQNSDISFDKQVSEDSLKTKSIEKLNTWTDNKYHALVDSLNVAYAMKVSSLQKGSKTKPMHYAQARNRLLHLSDKVPIKDSKGNTFESCMRIPPKYEDYMRSRYKYPKKDKGRPQPEKEQPGEDNVSDEELPDIPDVEEPRSPIELPDDSAPPAKATRARKKKRNN